MKKRKMYTIIAIIIVIIGVVDVSLYSRLKSKNDIEEKEQINIDEKIMSYYSSNSSEDIGASFNEGSVWKAQGKGIEVELHIEEGDNSYASYKIGEDSGEWEFSRPWGENKCYFSRGKFYTLECIPVPIYDNFYFYFKENSILPEGVDMLEFKRVEDN